MARDDSFSERQNSERPIVVIGAGIGGLSAAMRLVAKGLPVIVLDRAQQPGGKMRTVPSAAGPVDAGPTVLTMRHVFDDLFSTMGLRLDDHVTLIPQNTLARHFWPDGSQLDLSSDPDASERAIAAFSGAASAAEFARFHAQSAKLFDAFDAPMMQAAEPSLVELGTIVARDPALLAAMAPLRTMAGQLARRFSDKRLRQLFGRYATYVGGSPLRAPALLNLVAHSEARGVWKVKGGMHRLARTIAAVLERRGAEFWLGTGAARIETQDGTVTAVHLEDGHRISCSGVIFAGDPRALSTGALGQAAQTAIEDISRTPRSHSAQVWSFAAKARGPRAADLVHHNVFFASEPTSEFVDLGKGRVPREPSIYICAEDRGDGEAAPEPGAYERFEIILNAPPLSGENDQTSEDKPACQTRTFQMLDRMGLAFDPLPDLATLTTPQGFETLFPMSLGALYGQSPHGMTASLKRPRARTKIPGLYLAGGGTHPGAGVPMATLSGKHAAEAMLADRISTLPSRPMATHGGTSTA